MVIDDKVVDELKNPTLHQGNDSALTVRGQPGSLQAKLTYQLSEDRRSIREVLHLENPSDEDVELEDIRVGLRRAMNAENDPCRLVAVPYRR